MKEAFILILIAAFLSCFVPSLLADDSFIIIYYGREGPVTEGYKSPKPDKSPEGTVKNLYGNKLFFGLRNYCPATVTRHLSACFTPELIEHLESCYEEAEKWKAENRNRNLKLNIAEGPIFISGYEHPKDHKVGEARIEGDRAEVPISFSHSEGGKIYRWVDVALLRSVDGLWLLDDIQRNPRSRNGWSLKKRVSIED